MKITHQQGDPRDLTLLSDNARFMPHEVFARLVDNIQRDGVLQQWPFVWHDQETGVREVLSGNHRVEAAIQAGLDVIDWTECDEPLTKDQRLAIQLSHNAVVGEDDPTVLKRLYESIVDVDERLYSGLDDGALELMSEVDMTSLAEANLDFTTMTVVFLPEEYERAVQALADARELAGSDKTWLARDDQYERTLQALEDARDSAHIMNVATSLGLLLDVWDAHRTDLQEHWAETDGKHRVPLSTIFGTEGPTAADGQTILRAVKKLEKEGADGPLAALVKMAEEYLQA